MLNVNSVDLYDIIMRKLLLSFPISIEETEAHGGSVFGLSSHSCQAAEPEFKSLLY